MQAYKIPRCYFMIGVAVIFTGSLLFSFLNLPLFFKRESVCVDVHGYVLGAIRPGATVYLYRTKTLEFDPVLEVIRQAVPFNVGWVNASKEFCFLCLDYGLYVAAIPTASYKYSSVGSPLVRDYETGNASVNSLFQGGDHEYMLGAFSINKTDLVIASDNFPR